MTITKHYCDSCDKEMPRGAQIRLGAVIEYVLTGSEDTRLRGDFCCYTCMSDFVRCGGKPPKEAATEAA